MKNEHVLKSASALSFGGKALKAAAAAPDPAQTRSAADKKQRHAAAMSDQYRAMLLERYNAPYEFTSAYRHWGINE
jgi:hypothetical protein